MNITEFQNKRTELEIEGTGIDTTVTKDREWNHKVTKQVTFTIPAGSRVHIDFSPKKYPSQMFITIGDTVKVSRLTHAHKWIKGISKPPTIKTLERRAWNGISKSVTGKKVEADGYSYDGSPAWEMVLGII